MAHQYAFKSFNGVLQLLISKALPALAFALALLLIAESSATADQAAQTSALILKTDLVNPKDIIVPVTINGKRYKFLLDTAASFTAIDNQVAKAITQITKGSEIPLYLQQTLGAGVSTVAGPLQKSDIKLWRPLSMQIGSEVIPGVSPWFGIDLTLMSQAIGQQIDGLLGVDMFRQLSWAVHNRHKTLSVWKFEPSALGYQQCQPYLDRYAKAPFMELTFGSEPVFF